MFYFSVLGDGALLGMFSHFGLSFPNTRSTTESLLCDQMNK